MEGFFSGLVHMNDSITSNSPRRHKQPGSNSRRKAEAAPSSMSTGVISSSSYSFWSTIQGVATSASSTLTSTTGSTTIAATLNRNQGQEQRYQHKSFIGTKGDTTSVQKEHGNTDIHDKTTSKEDQSDVSNVHDHSIEERQHQPKKGQSHKQSTPLAIPWREMGSWLGTTQSGATIWAKVLRQLDVSVRLLSETELTKIKQLIRGIGWMDNVDENFRLQYGDFYDAYKRERGSHHHNHSTRDVSTEAIDSQSNKYDNDMDASSSTNKNDNSATGTCNDNNRSVRSNASDGGSGYESFTYKIQKDINRTFGLFCRSSQVASFVFGLKRGAYLKSLHHLLVAASRKYGYCQGMNFIAANFLLHYPEKDSFILFCYLMEKRCMEVLFNPKSACLVDYIKLFEKRLKLHYKKVYEHLKSIGFVGFCYAIEWFTTCFLVSNPNELSACVMDMLMIDIKDTLIRIGLAVIANLESHLLQYDLEQMQVHFKSMVLGLKVVDVISVAVSITSRGGEGEDVLKKMWHQVKEVNQDGSNSNEEINGSNKHDRDRHLSDDFGMPISPIQVYSDKIAARLSWINHEDHELYKPYEGDVEWCDFFNRDIKPRRLKSVSTLNTLRKNSLDGIFQLNDYKKSRPQSTSSPVASGSSVPAPTTMIVSCREDLSFDGDQNTEYSFINGEKTRELMKHENKCCTLGEDVSYHGQDPTQMLRVKCRHRRSRRARRAFIEGNTDECHYLGLRVLKSKYNRVDGYSRRVSVFCTSVDVYIQIGLSLIEIEREQDDYSLVEIVNGKEDSKDTKEPNYDSKNLRKDSEASSGDSSRGSFLDIHNDFPDSRNIDIYEKELTRDSYSPRINLLPCTLRELNLNVTTESIDLHEPQGKYGKNIDSTCVPFAWIPVVFSDWFSDDNSLPISHDSVNITISSTESQRNHVFRTFQTGIVKDIDSFIALEELDKDYKQLTSESDVENSTDFVETRDDYFSDVNAAEIKNRIVGPGNDLTAKQSVDEKLLIDMIARGETMNLSPHKDPPMRKEDEKPVQNDSYHDAVSSRLIEGAMFPRPRIRRAGRRPIKFTKLNSAAIINKLTMRKAAKSSSSNVV